MAASRLTRGAMAREAAFLTQDSTMDEPQQLSSPPPTPDTRVVKKGAALTATPKRKTKAKKITDIPLGSSPPTTPKAGEKKRKRGVTKVAEDVNALPHSLGSLVPPTKTADDVTEQEVEQEIPAKKRRGRKSAKIVDYVNTLPHNLGTAVPSLNTEDDVAKEEFWQDTPTKKRPARKSAKVIDDVNTLPHNLGPVVTGTVKEQNVAQGEATVEKPRGQKLAIDQEVELAQKVSSDEVKDEANKEVTTKTPGQKKGVHQAANKGVNAKFEGIVNESAGARGASEEKETRKKRVPKLNKYGLMPGVTPFPNHAHPTPEECQQVHDLLTAADGKNARPERIPPPSLMVTGCGEVPSVLDALIRTRLSAATTAKNSAYAFKGLENTFGITDKGIGKGSVDWEKVRLADVKDIETAIRKGGLQVAKSKDIKLILERVYEEGQARRDALIAAKLEGTKGPAGPEQAEESVLSLQHLHALNDSDAMEALCKYPGIGVKTAACILLFCLRRESFAVDTHVFRFAQWLNWVPEKATRDTSFSHLEVKIPNGLKYPLHQLFIFHGRNCPRCRARTEESEGKKKGCPIDHLVTRTWKAKENGAKGKGPKGKGKGKGVKEGGPAPAKESKTKKSKMTAESDEEEDEVEEEMEVDNEGEDEVEQEMEVDDEVDDDHELYLSDADEEVED